MLIVRKLPAHPALRTVVSGFTERRGTFSKRSSVRPLPARPDQFLEFFLGESYRVRPPGGDFFTSPEVALVGPMTVPVAELAFEGTIETFTIHFEPTGLSRLFGVPMAILADVAPPARDVLGRHVGPLEDAVRRVSRFEQRIAAAEAWIGGFLGEARAQDPVDRAARLLARANGRPAVATLAERAGLSARQLQRRFIEAVGVAPKHYARLHRFAAAIAARETHPTRPWTDIAHACGFADQAHLIREFQTLSGRAPGEFFRAVSSVPEALAAPMSDSFKRPG
jgi:AraC-like DNA-binding protein